MLADARMDKIREILLEYKHIDLNTLSSLLSVSMATIRRDLDKLEQERFLVRAHGGAFLNESDDEVRLSDAEDPFAPQKREIGILAAALVDDNDVVFLGGGRTCLEIARHLKDKKNVTVVTNNVNVIWEFAAADEFAIQAIGGNVETVDGTVTLAGDTSTETLGHMYFNKAFVSVDAVDIEKGYFSNSPQQAKIIRLLKQNSSDLIVAADYGKFGKRAFSFIGELELSKKIVTNMNLHESFKKKLFESGFQLFMTIENQ